MQNKATLALRVLVITYFTSVEPHLRNVEMNSPQPKICITFKSVNSVLNLTCVVCASLTNLEPI